MSTRKPAANLPNPLVADDPDDWKGRLKTNKADKNGNAAESPQKPPYEPTPTEEEALKAYLDAKEKRGPRLKLVTENNSAKIDVDHADSLFGIADLMRAIGTTDFDFCNGLIGQLANASKETQGSVSGANFMLSVVKGVEPRDQIEAMLAAQMAAVHMASMRYARLRKVLTLRYQGTLEGTR
jgi:hypothetical protein